MKIKILCIVCFLSVHVCAQTPELMVNLGHSFGVMSAACSPDGRTIVSGSEDKTVKVWEAATGRLLRTLKGHTSKVYSVRYSPDGRLIASGSGDGTIRLWEAATGRIVKTLEAKNSFVISLQYSPSGKTIANADNKMICVWDATQGKLLHTLNGHTSLVRSVNYSSDGKTIVSGGDDKTIRIWDVATGRLLKTFQGVGEYVRSVACSPDGRTIAIGAGKSVFVCDALTGEQVWTVKGNNRIASVEYSPDGCTIVSGSADPQWTEAMTIEKRVTYKSDKPIMLWEASTGKLIRTADGPPNNASNKGISSVAFSPNGSTIICANEDKTISIWEVGTGRLVRTFEGHSEYITSIQYASDGKTIVGGSNEGKLYVWDVTTGKLGRTLNAHTGSVVSVTYSPDLRNILSGSETDGTITIRDAVTGVAIRSFKHHTVGTDYYYNWLQTLTYSPDGKYVASGSQDKLVKVWDAATGALLRTLVHEDKSGLYGQVEAVTYSPDGTMVVSAGDNGVIKIWNAATGGLVRGIEAFASALAYSPDGRFLLGGSTEGDITVWDVSTGKIVRTLKGHTWVILSLSYSPDCRTIISGCKRGEIKLWDAATGKLIRTLKGHTDQIRSVRFSPDGKTIVSGSYDGTVRFWSTATGAEILKLFTLGSGGYVVVAPDGRFDGTPEGLKQLHFVKGLEAIPLEALYEEFYTPNLLGRMLGGETLAKTGFDINTMSNIPVVKILSPANNSSVKTPQMTITVQATDKGGGIDEIKLFHNGKIVETTGRGMKRVVDGSDVTKSFTITLVGGRNTIRATAFNAQRTEGIPSEIAIRYEGSQASANLYMIVAGVNKYKNPKYVLNYAIADASAFKEAIESKSRGIFGTIETVYLQNEDVTRERILDGCTKIRMKAKAEDVFIFYYAGHGVMSEEKKPQFYIIPFDITQLYGDNAMLQQKGVSAGELQTFSQELKVQKQLYILDACQSGGVVELLASRGAAEEKAIAQLARSTGTYWITASGSQQFATEFAQLGHGLLTYTILEGIKGGAKIGIADGKITVESLSTFVKNKLPEFSEKYKGEAQYPASYGYGNDFPISIVQ